MTPRDSVCISFVFSFWEQETQWMPDRLHTKILPASFPTKVLMLLIAEFLEPSVLSSTEINFYICLVYKRIDNTGKFDSFWYSSMNYSRHIHSVKKLLWLKIISTAVVKPRLPQIVGRRKMLCCPRSVAGTTLFSMAGWCPRVQQ